jgi:predicted DNA-binding transcriptional regulator YafY
LPTNPNSARLATTTRLARVLLYLHFGTKYRQPDMDAMAAHLGYSKRTLYRDLEAYRAGGLRIARSE